MSWTLWTLGVRYSQTFCWIPWSNVTVLNKRYTGYIRMRRRRYLNRHKRVSRREPENNKQKRPKAIIAKATSMGWQWAQNLGKLEHLQQNEAPPHRPCTWLKQFNIARATLAIPWQQSSIYPNTWHIMVEKPCVFFSHCNSTLIHYGWTWIWRSHKQIEILEV